MCCVVVEASVSMRSGVRFPRVMKAVPSACLPRTHRVTMPGDDESSTASTSPGEDEPPTLVTIGDDELCCVLAQATFTSLTHFKAAASRFGPFCRRTLATDARFAAARAVFAGGDTRPLTRDVLCVSLLQNDDVWSTEAVLRVRLPLPMPGAASYRGGFSWSYDPDPPSLPCSDCRKPFPDGSLRLSTGGTVRACSMASPFAQLWCSR